MELKLNMNFTSQLNTQDNSNKIYDLAVVGGGPAALNAALYAKRKGNDVIIIAGSLGGQVLNTSVVENYLGFETLSGEQLVNRFVAHVKALAIPVMEYVMVDDMMKEPDGHHTLQLTDGSSVRAKAVVLATGSQSRKLGVDGEDRLAGRGVAYCAICDAPLYKGKDVLVAGGGNAAVEAAIDLSKVASSVTIVHRSQFRADQILLEQMAKKDNITYYLETEILEIVGDQVVSGVLVRDKTTDDVYEIAGDGIFIEIGHIPNTQVFDGIVAMNNHNEIIVDEKQQTNIPGVYAAGDMTTTPYKQIIVAVAEGAKAALSANEYINAFETDNDTDDLNLVTL